MEKQEFTWSDIKEMFAETDRQIKKTERLFKESNAKFERSRKDFDKRKKESNEDFYRQIKESREDLERLRKESNENFERQMKESREDFDRRMKELHKLIGGIGNSNGEMAEEYFYNIFKRDKTFVNEKYDRMHRNFVRTDGIIEAEFDIVLINGSSAAIIEIKYNAKPDNIDIDELIDRAGMFKILFPECKHHKIYLGVAAMAFKNGLAQKLRKAGIATVHHIGKKMVVYDKEVKAF
jgi:hypothetical protein